ncbi:putative transcription factor TGA7-like isoform X1 [Capsicum annuum]|nr:putative transcription factor TGA7-like isoform X1 [Capsicum annuum]
MTRKASCCGICENSNLPSICTLCVNYRLNEYNTVLKSLKGRREALCGQLSEVLLAKGKADDQLSWRVPRNEKLARLKEKLRQQKEQVSQGKAKIEKMSHDLKVQYELLGSATRMMAITSELLHKQSVVVKQICRLFPQRHVTVDGEKKDGSSGQYDSICNARLPRGLDPHSVPSDELGASLGYLAVDRPREPFAGLGAENESIHNSGFAGSCSRIWQRDSYWDASPSSRSGEYPLFIPRQNFCSSGGEASWYDRSCSNSETSSDFGVYSMESDRKPRLDSSSSSSFNYASASLHSIETHKDLQKGIALLKKSVACITAYCYNTLCLEVPAEASTFETFARLLATLSSSKEVRSVFSLKMSGSRASKQVQQLNRSVWNADSAGSSSTLVESGHVPVLRNTFDDALPSSTANIIYATEASDVGRNENLIEDWDLIEHPPFPPPPSQTEDVEHWTRAMFIDATKK